MILQDIFNIGVGLIGSVFFWTIKENWKTLESLKKKDGELTLQIAQKYAELNHKLTGKDQFIMAHYATKLDLDKMLSHLDKRLDKSDVFIEKLNAKIDDLKERK